MLSLSLAVARTRLPGSQGPKSCPDPLPRQPQAPGPAAPPWRRRPRPPLQLAARPARARRRALIGCAGSAAAFVAGRFAGSGLQRRLAHRRERSRGARSPACQSQWSGEPRGSAPGAAVLAAMCSQLWFLTDRRIREDYPQVQILRALRQRCSEQDVRFRAVLMDQIAVTVVGGHLGEREGPWEGGGARRGPREQAGGRAPPGLPQPSLVRAPQTSRFPPRDLFGLEKAPNLESFL